MSIGENENFENSTNAKEKSEIITGKPAGLFELLGEEEREILESIEKNNVNSVQNEENSSEKVKMKRQKCVVFWIFFECIQ